MIRAVRLALIVLVSSACSLFPAPTPSPTVWADRVPTAAPEVIAAQPVIPSGPDLFAIRPVSPTGAIVGTDYAYEMPHCGIHSPIDVDGSFWDAVGMPQGSVDFDGQLGTFRLVSPTEATFTRADGMILRLVRHSGAKEFRSCL